MKNILRKDLPWMLVLAVGGAIGLAFAVAERGFLHLFVLAPHRLDVAFYIAGGAGLLLGAVSVLWDDLLGTREFLVQRPLSRHRLASAPIVACLVVLLVWMLCTPVLAWLFAATYSGIFEFSFWTGVPEILATLLIAWPMAAIGCLCAAMPASGWVRLAAATTLTVAVGASIDSWSQTSDGFARMDVFVGLCLVSAGLLFAAARFMHTMVFDGDRPWPSAARRFAGTLFVVATAATMAGIVGQAQNVGLRGAQREYPEIARLDGEIVLAVRDSDWQNWMRCNRDHVVIGAPMPRARFEQIPYRGPATGSNFEIEAPRWHSYGRTASVASYRARILLDHRGRSWLHSYERGTIDPTGLGPERRAFPPECELEQITELSTRQRAVLVGHRESGRIWRFDASLGYFVELPLPDGDLFRSVRHADRDRIERDGRLPTALAAFFEGETWLTYASGENGAYALRDGQWERVAASDARQVPTASRALKLVGDDPLCFTVQVLGEAGEPVFEHDFAPRTWSERLHAAHAMFWSTLRPPVLQLLGSAFSTGKTRDNIAVDRLLVGGRRLWLLALCVVVSVFTAFGVRRRLARIGGDAGTRRFWTTAVLLTGPICAVAALICEPARAHARRAQTVAPPVPRIITAPVLQESQS